MMREAATALMVRLKPPAYDADPKTVMAWRWFIALTTGALTMALTAHIALACGLLATATGYSGFASSADFEMLKTETTQRRVRELQKEMLDAKQKQCAASGEAKRLYFDAYNDLRAEYFTLTKREFPDPPCSDFS